MEVVIDWIIKVAFRNGNMRSWMRENVHHWGYLIDWLKENNEPPQSFMGYGAVQGNQTMKLCKRTRDATTTSQYRYDKRRNQVLNFYRKNSLIKLKHGQDIPDTSHEVDMDQHHLDEFKLVGSSKITYLEDRFMGVFRSGYVLNELDELVSVRMCDNDSSNWEPTDKGKLILAGVYEETLRARELKQIDEQFLKKKLLERQQKQMQLRQQQQQQEQAQAQAQSSGIGSGARNAADHHNQAKRVDPRGGARQLHGQPQDQERNESSDQNTGGYYQPSADNTNEANNGDDDLAQDLGTDSQPVNANDVDMQDLSEEEFNHEDP